MDHKVLFFDIETSPNFGWFWRTGKQYIGPDNITDERQIIMIHYMWLGEKKTTRLDWGLSKQCDKAMLEKFIPILESADLIVFQNGNRFDLPWVLGRAWHHDIPARPDYVTFDTYRKAKSQFNLNSYRLDYMDKFTGGPGKMDTGGMKLWLDIILSKDEKALNKMHRYCERDVKRLVAMYKKLTPYVKATAHAGVNKGFEKWTCPHCGTHQVESNGPYTTAQGTIKRRMRCVNKHYYVISDRDYINYQKAKRSK